VKTLTLDSVEWDGKSTIAYATGHNVKGEQVRITIEPRLARDLAELAPHGDLPADSFLVQYADWQVCW
jgi:hypothetical protein